ncbi:MAG: glycosyltransferase family 4 protein, partial [Burkholderiales bacterium]|nr:glycosyltransferase family 4 protein [Burkholderiales bacterium]
SLLPCASDYMVAHGMQRDKFNYIPNGVAISTLLNNTDQIPVEHQVIINNAKNTYPLLIGYAGGMGDSNALEYLIEVATIKSNVAFILVGNGAVKQNLIDATASRKLTNVFILHEINKPQIPNFLSQMDILYIGWHKLSIYRFGICPNKLFDYMLSKKPILHSVTAGNDLVAQAHCGISVEAQNIDAISNAVDIFFELKLNNCDELNSLGKNGYEYVINNHDYKILAQKFLE